MNQTIKKAIIWIATIIGISLIGYGVVVTYFLHTLNRGCGFDDGPFVAVVIDTIILSPDAQEFEISHQGKLIINNRKSSKSPIISLVENEKVKSSLDMDTRNTLGYEATTLQKLSEVVITRKNNPIEMKFISHWTFGAEVGSMEINRKNGENTFCLSW